MNEVQRPAEDWAFCYLKESRLTRLLQAHTTSFTECIGKPSQTVLSCSFKYHLHFCKRIAHFHRSWILRSSERYLHSCCRNPASVDQHRGTAAKASIWRLAASLQRPWGWFSVCFSFSPFV